MRTKVSRRRRDHGGDAAADRPGRPARMGVVTDAMSSPHPPDRERDRRTAAVAAAVERIYWQVNSSAM